MVKIGVLGVGHLGKIHLQQLKEISSVEITGFYDPNDVSAEEVMKTYGIRRFASEDELIDASDAIDIVTPTLYHYEVAARAVKKFKHVFIEKPLTATIQEGQELMELAKEAGIKVQVGHVERFNPAFLAVAGAFNRPMFIEAHRLSEFNPRGTDVSVVLDLMIHDLDIILNVVKGGIKRISASGVAVVSDTPDIANARIEFNNGCVANLTASRISMKKMRKIRFFQKDAYIAVDFLKKKSEIVKLKTVTGEPDPLAMTIDLKEKGVKQIYFENPEAPAVNAVKLELEEFASSIINDTVPPVTIEDGYLALQVAHQILEKMRIDVALAV